LVAQCGGERRVQSAGRLAEPEYDRALRQSDANCNSYRDSYSYAYGNINNNTHGYCYSPTHANAKT
jgi:hypothetical protein